jgi:nitrite reductase (NO-forming)
LRHNSLEARRREPAGVAHLSKERDVIFTGFGIDVAWAFAATALLVAAWLIAWGFGLEASDERERRGVGPEREATTFAPSRGRALAIVAALAAVGLGATWATHGPASPSAAPTSAVLSARVARHVATGATPIALVHRHERAGSEPAALPPVARGRVVHVAITVEDRVLDIAPGVRYDAWTFNGRVPGPTIHVRVGQRVDVKFTNDGSMPHSLDFHSARVAPDRAYRDIAPGETMHVSFVAERPGVFLYHCVTAPAVAHIANGMYGAMIVDPKRPLPPARSFVLTTGEWYTNGQSPARLDFRKALAMTPDWATFNGRAFQYDDAPLHARPGERVRFYVINAGPNLIVPFHLVGGIFDRAYVDGDMTHWLRDVQTTDVAPGGAAIFDARFPQRGVYGFVNHSFANAEKGEIGTLLVGVAHGTMSH